MTKTAENAKSVELRDPATVMRLARMGSFHQTRISFMRTILRRIKREGWVIDCPVWRIDDKGVGVAVYAARGPERTYSLVAFAHDLPPDMRTDRVIAEAWDTTYALYDGVPTDADIERLADNVPKQEAGRCSETELVLSRANRSVRLFEHVVSSLAEGRQPDENQITSVGYLMRTTAVYGNGKFGLADRHRIADRREAAGAFQTELLTVWLIRTFTVDLAEHLARVRNPEGAVRLDRTIRRRLGVGNSTGLGMAPFLMTHPALLNCWMEARETALARVRGIQTADEATRVAFRNFLRRAMRLADEWHTADERQAARIPILQADLKAFKTWIDGEGAKALKGPQPWDAVWRWADANLSLEGQEMAVTLLLEPHGDLVDELGADLQVDEQAAFRINGSVTVGAARAEIEGRYGWALGEDYDCMEGCARFWYVSEAKLEPRLGERHDEPGAELEEPLDVGRAVHGLHRALEGFEDGEPLAAFLLKHPEHRHTVRRLQITSRYPYAEIRDNLVGADMLPIDMLRCKLSFFGATKFDPRSDRWVRITMYQDAPFPDEVAEMATVAEVDDWAFPPLPDEDGA